MKDLYFIVEGETESEFVKELLIPHLNKSGVTSNIQPIKITMRGGGHGFNKIEHFRNTIEPLLSYKARPVITTMVDFFRIPNGIPGYPDCMEKILVDDQIDCLENGLIRAVNDIKEYKGFVPYIQKHEFEALLFSNVEKGFDLEEDKIKEAVLEISKRHVNPEDINSSPEGAPSKRLQKIYKDAGSKYQKGADAVNIALFGGIESMLEKCPRFKTWIDRLIEEVSKD